MLLYKRIYYKVISKMTYYYYRLFDENINICKGLSIRSNVNFNVNGGELFIGKNVFFNNGCSINSRRKIIIGNNCLFGENVHIYSENKPISLQGFTTKEVSIGDNCWIGTGVTILKGVTIGNNCVIGANCLIYDDVPSYSIVKSSQKLIIEAIDKEL